MFGLRTPSKSQTSAPGIRRSIHKWEVSSEAPKVAKRISGTTSPSSPVSGRRGFHAGGKSISTTLARRDGSIPAVIGGVIGLIFAMTVSYGRPEETRSRMDRNSSLASSLASLISFFSVYFAYCKTARSLVAVEHGSASPSEPSPSLRRLRASVHAFQSLLRSALHQYTYFQTVGR
ncbi:unnamed protein product [Pieris brassicae]|uniref:Uncharacterized protein n=1 Tax=Pieris brassicae TaxID=7116 RepID=A0A9P0TN21_PIEBR|nr:unnamed protein product [Pieris brassicae]